MEVIVCRFSGTGDEETCTAGLDEGGPPSTGQPPSASRPTASRPPALLAGPGRPLQAAG